MADRLHLSAKHRRILEKLLREHLPGVEAWAYGSRVNGRSHDGSDLDLVLRGRGLDEVSINKLADFAEALRESNIPFLVEAHDWARLPKRFHREIEREHVLFLGPARYASRKSHRFSLNDLIDLTLSSVDKKSKEHESPVRLCNYMDVYSNSFIHGGMDFMKATATVREIKNCARSAGDVVITKDSEKYDDIGVPAFVKENVPDLICGYHLAILRPRPKRIDGKYLYYGLCTDEAKRQFHAYANGVTRFGLRKADIGLVELPVPPLTEQRAIARILGALDDKIELNRRMNETLESMARAIFKDWFVDFGPTRAKMEGRSPYLAPELWDLFPNALDDQGKPVGWEVKPLDEVASFLNGLALQNFAACDGEDSLPVIKIAELRGGITAKSNRASREVPGKYIVNDGDFLFSWSGSLLAKFWTEGEGALNQHLFKVTSNRYPAWFFGHWIYHHLEHFKAIAASKATTMGHIQRGHLKEATSHCPPDDVLAILGEAVGPLVERTIKNDLESRTLARARDLLLPKFMSGEICLRDAEEDVQHATACRSRYSSLP